MFSPVWNVSLNCVNCVAPKIPFWKKCLLFAQGMSAIPYSIWSIEHFSPEKVTCTMKWALTGSGGGHHIGRPYTTFFVVRNLKFYATLVCSTPVVNRGKPIPMQFCNVTPCTGWLSAFLPRRITTQHKVSHEALCAMSEN